MRSANTSINLASLRWSIYMRAYKSGIYDERCKTDVQACTAT
jgi:hypothetical protein